MSSPIAASRSTAGSRGLAVILLFLLFGVAAVGLFVSIPSEESVNQVLLRDLSEARVGGGRLFRASPTPFEKSRYEKTLAKAELSVLSMRDSPLKQRIQGLIDAGTGNLQDAARILQTVNESDPHNAEVLNDLGVVYLALGKQSAVNYFRALTLFERARELSPHAAAPRFNIVMAYRLAGIRERFAMEMAQYKRLEISSFWKRELSAEPTDAQMIAALRESLARADLALARKLIARDAERYRAIAMDYALAPSNAEPLDDGIKFILNTLRNSAEDRTVEAIVAPLDTVDAQKFSRARMLVREGIKAYQQGRLTDSARLYDLAEEAIKGSGLLFDELWIKLNRADIDIRSLNNAAAAPAIEHVIAKAQEAKLLWLLGHALASQGSNVQLTRNFGGSVRILQKAVSIFSSVGASRDAARAMSYLAAIHAGAGDLETSLQLICEALSITRPDDHVRLSTLYLTAGLQLYRMGFPKYAIELEELATIHARASENPGMMSAAAMNVSMIYAANQDYAEAEQSLTKMNASMKKLESGPARDILAVQSNIVCGRIKIGTGNPSAGEECLNGNLDIFNRQPFKVPIYVAQTLLEMSRAYALQGRLESARQKLQEAVERIEEDDLHQANTGLRMSFENERRSLYDVAVAFEYDNGDRNTAWSYVQQYRSKLFLEFLRQMNPGIAVVQSQALHRDKVQQLLPQNVQVIEYVMLKDRLLIWLVSKDRFTSVAVPITRAELETRVSTFIKLTQSKAELAQQAEELHRVLIAPIEGQLDPHRTLAIVPDQALHRLNFSALRSATDNTYLIERYALLESPSLTSLLFPGSGSPRRAGAVAFGAQSDDTQASMELRKLKPFYSDVRTYDGTRALKPAFLSSLVDAGVFHYAGHSQDASDPLRSSILLDGNTEGPNSVSAVDIAARRMPPNSVVVLASCDSSVGNSRDGLGIRGLTSAFLISGAGSVVGSLWLVEAQSTSRLVISFHEGFAKEQLPVTEALRRAQLRFISRGIHPYYWSGFVATGNLSALR